MKNRLHLIRPGKTFANILLNINCFKILPQMTRGSSFQEEFVDFLVTFRSSHADVFHKKVFLDILQNSQENSCARDSLLIKMHKKIHKNAFYFTYFNFRSQDNEIFVLTFHNMLKKMSCRSCRTPA